jgi:hypothetical protein
MDDEEGGSPVADQIPAEPGYYTESDINDDDKTPSAQIACPIGTYNNYYHRGECLACYPGYYCPKSGTADTMVYCPQGAWCPEGSDIYTLCPMGTYGPNTHMSSEVEACLRCPPSMYC